MICATLAQFVAAQLPASEAEGWRRREFDPDASYPDEQFETLLREASAATNLTRRELGRAFGVFTAKTTFVQLYPQYYAASGGTREFLLNIEQTIHELVRETIPGAYPPRLGVRPLGADGVVISYTSERRLCGLLEGLVAGTAEYYGERFTIDEAACIERGDAACAFIVERVAA